MVETEIKLRWDRAPEDAHAMLLSHGYSIAAPRELEIDQLYDRNEELRSTDRLLRVRRSGDRSILTYKGPARRGPHKSREELETAIADGGAFVSILDALGFTPAFRYEKYRTTFSRPGESGLVTLDETPIGVFLELEGAADWIDRTALAMGFTQADFISASYGSLYADYRRQHPGVPPDMKF